jgi:adenylate cyclase
MAHNRTKRRLAAILAVDVVGYSQMMAEDEAGTLAAWRNVRADVFDPKVSEFGGRVFKTLGDGMLVEFSSAVDAVSCAMAFQSEMAERNNGLRLRVSVNVGDVVIEGDDIFGDGVNVAARLEAEAEPGGVIVSDAVREYLLGRIDVEFRDGDERNLKNIDRPIRVWHWSPASAAAEPIPPPTLPAKPSIAVLPFDNLSGNQDLDFIADGIVESITAALSRIRAFFVIARNSAFTYKGKPINLRDVGRELGVAYALEGSVQRVGHRVRITVQLIETVGGAHVWADKYDGTIDDIFDLQDMITEQVAGALQPSIRAAEVERARRKRPQELGAYGYTMRAMRHVWMLERESADRGLELLSEALKVDPEYPLALALAGWCWAQRAVYNWTDDREASIAEALRLAEQAARTGGDDPLTLTVLGTVHTIAKNHETARLILERAVSIDPNSAWAWSRLGWVEAYAGRCENAEANFHRALRLSPLDPLNFNNYVGLGGANMTAGKYEVAVKYLERALRERPNAHWIRRALTANLCGAGELDRARAMAKELLVHQPGFTIARYVNAMPFTAEICERIAAQLRKLDLPE